MSKLQIKLESADLRGMVEQLLIDEPNLCQWLLSEHVDIRKNKWSNHNTKYVFPKNLDLTAFRYSMEPPDRSMKLDDYTMSNHSVTPGFFICLVVDRSTGYLHGYYADRYVG